MFKQNKNFKHGFTIIEVVLVLAVAALIFLMDFVAVPAMRIMQRDTARANDVNRVTTQLNSYQSNKNGKIPSMDQDAYVSGHTDVDNDVFKSAGPTSWAYFYDAYLIGVDTKQKFSDPDGQPYSLEISSCKAADSYDPETKECKNGQRTSYSFTQQSEGTEDNTSNDRYASKGTAGHTISIVVNSTCNDETAVHSTGGNKVSILYKREGGGVICRSI